MKTRTAASLTCLAIATLFAGTASAAAYCDAGVPTADGLTYADVTFRGANSDDCYGVVLGNENAANINAIDNWDNAALGLWALAAKDETAGSGTNESNTIAGIKFTVNGYADTDSGTWTLSWTDTNGVTPQNFPVFFDFVVVTKASDRFAAYLLTEELLAASPNTGSGEWEINYKNNGGNIPDLSHLSVYARYNNKDPGGPPSEIPEPGMLLAYGAGLLTFALARRRRNT